MIKIAPLCRYIDSFHSRTIKHILVHTGQHYDQALSGNFYKELNIPLPTIQLSTGSDTHAQQTARIMSSLEPVMIREKPDWVIVIGDVNSTLAATLVAAKLSLRVAHIEAGLRSFDRNMPEEINRVVTDQLADLLLTPSIDADHNLLNEGVSPERVKRVGNIMIDTLINDIETARQSDILKRFRLESGQYCYATLHRPANVDDPYTLAKICETLHEISKKIPIIFPLHPRTKANLYSGKIPIQLTSRLKLVEPVGYHDSIKLTDSAKIVLTDSGGIQEESTFLGTPCLTLRDNTERPITITQGTNKLTNLKNIHDDIDSILNGYFKQGSIPDYWDGKTTERILSNLLNC